MFNIGFATRASCTLRDYNVQASGSYFLLQANLALSPTALLPSPKSPEVKLQPAPLPSTTPCSPLSPLTARSPTPQPSRLPSEEEDPVSFENPPDGTPLPSINKVNTDLHVNKQNNLKDK